MKNILVGIRLVDHKLSGQSRVAALPGASARAKTDLTLRVAQLRSPQMASRRGAKRTCVIGLAWMGVVALLYLLFFTAVRVVQMVPAPNHVVIPHDLRAMFGPR